LKPRHDTESDADENKRNDSQETWPGEESTPLERGLMTSEKKFWVQIAATVVSPLIVAGVLWFGAFMGNTATKDDLKELRTEIKDDIDRVEKRIEGVRTEIKDDIDRVEKRIDRVEKKIDRVEKRIDRVEKKIEGVEKKIDRVEKKIEAQTERIDRLLLHLVPKEKK